MSMCPDALDYFAFAPGASINRTDPGLIAAEGNVDQVALKPYEGDPPLATITLVNTALIPEEYLLTLGLAHR